MSLNLDKMKKYLESEEGKKDIEEYFEGLKRQSQESRDYFESEDFNKNLNLLKSWMIQNNVYIADSEDFQMGGYWIKKEKRTIPYPITEDIFYKITYSISDSLDAYEKIDESNPFSNSYIEYNDFIIRHIHGQGTITTIELDISKSRDKNVDKIIQ